MRSGGRDMELLVKDYRLVIAEVQYYLPDHPRIICPHTLTWMQIDLPPEFPRLLRFLRYWEEHLDGKIHSVKMDNTQLIRPNRFRHVRGMLRLH
jgi:uncharacterized protein Usg